LERYFFITYIHIDKNVYCQNEKQIDKFTDEQKITKIAFEENSDKIGCVEINVEISDHFEYLIEYMFRKLGKDIIACVCTKCDNFEKLKKMNVMIPKIYEKMLEEEDRRGCTGVVYANVSDYKLIELLEKYDVYYYIYGYDENSEIDQMYKESMKQKINEYREIENINII
jgi:hypothetical protein